MPTYLVTAPDGRKFRVAGEGTQEDALAQVQAQYQQQSQSRPTPSGGPRRGGARTPAPPSASQQLERQLALTARLPIDAVAAIPLAAADAGIAGRNLITGSNYESASSMYQTAMSSVFPTPETGIEKGVNIVGSAVASARLPVPSVPNSAPAVAPVAISNTAQQVIREGEKHGVPVFFDDVARSPFAKKLGTATDSLPGPIGTSAGREAQGKAAQEAAQRVTERLASTSDDVPELVQKGLQVKLASFKKSAATLYGRASQALDPLGDVPRARFDRAISDEGQRQAKLGTLASKEVLALLDKYRTAPPGNFTLMRELRSQLGEEISDFYTGKNAAIGDRGVKALRAMQEAVESDMAEFAKRSGAAGYRAWKAADGFYKANIVPFKAAGFRDLVKTAEPEKAWRYLLSQGSINSRAVRMYNSLDEQGRSAVRYGLVKDALGNGTNPNGTFSPVKFAKYLEDHEAAVNAFFRGRDLQEIRGFQNLMRGVERAGQYAENPPTGNRLVPFLLGGATLIEPATGAAIAGTGFAVTRLFQTRAGRDLLLAASRATGATLDRVSGRVARFLAVASAQGSSSRHAAKSSEEQQTERQDRPN